MGLWFLSLIQMLVSAYFSAVPEMTTRQLSPSMVLVDVRSPEEFAVSHIQGAVNLQSVEDVLHLSRKHPNQHIVIYCSVGVRSGIVARDVLKQIKTDSPMGKIYNLQGGIFRWAIEGKALVNQQGSVAVVHGFGWPWKYLLPAEIRGQ
ncbi:MAG: rhodanese-like domain-containing protein [Limnobacter sp.]|nr:rhodanese-like domain-containing protein [Limnobacter sp.]